MQQPKKINYTALHKLSVLIHQDGLCFYIYDRNGVVINEFIRSFKYALNPIELLDEIEKMYLEEPLLLQEFAAFKLIYHHDIFSMVPTVLFEEDNASDYLKYNTRLLKTDVVSIDESVDAFETTCVYIAYSNINNYFHERYGAFEYNHYSSLLVNALASFLTKQPLQVFLDIKDSFFYLTLVKDGKLILHNIYPQQAPEDILYYTMFAANHNGFDPEIMHVQIIQLEQDKQVFDLLYTYIRNVEHISESDTFIKNITCA